MKLIRHFASHKRCTILALALFLFPIAQITAQNTTESIDVILKKLESNQVFNTAKIEMTLNVSNRFGLTSNQFSSYSRKGGDALIEITAGPDRGQKILRQKNNIYLFYPDAEEVIWLKGSALKESMMGSDFSYEDLTDEGTIQDRFTARVEGIEEIDDHSCYHLILIANSRTETYAKQELWVDTELFVSRKAFLYSASGKPIREMTASNIKNISGKEIPFTTVMKDLLKKNTSTEMTIIKAEIDIPLSEKYFNRDELSW